MIKLFVYGIFTNRSTQQSVLGYIPKQEDAVLEGYSISNKLVLGQYKTIKPDSDGMTSGVLLYLKDSDLITTDRVEGVSHGLYKRITIDNWMAYIH